MHQPWNWWCWEHGAYNGNCLANLHSIESLPEGGTLEKGGRVLWSWTTCWSLWWRCVIVSHISMQHSQSLGSSIRTTRIFYRHSIGSGRSTNCCWVLLLIRLFSSRSSSSILLSPPNSRSSWLRSTPVYIHFLSTEWTKMSWPAAILGSSCGISNVDMYEFSAS